MRALLAVLALLAGMTQAYANESCGDLKHWQEYAKGLGVTITAAEEHRFDSGAHTLFLIFIDGSSTFMAANEKQEGEFCQTGVFMERGQSVLVYSEARERADITVKEIIKLGANEGPET